MANNEFFERFYSTVERNLPRFNTNNAASIKSLKQRLKRVLRKVTLSRVSIAFNAIVAITCACLLTAYFVSVSVKGNMLEFLADNWVGIFIVMFFSASIFLVSMSKESEYVSEAKFLCSELGKHTATDVITVTLRSAHLYVACILTACAGLDDKAMEDAALRLKRAIDRLQAVRMNFKTFIRMNNVPQGDKFIELADMAAQVIAIKIHLSVNTLVGLGIDEFVQKAAPAAAEECSKINDSLEQVLGDLVSCVNRDPGKLNQVFGKVNILFGKYQKIVLSESLKLEEPIRTK